MDEICIVEYCRFPVCNACIYCDEFPVFWCQSHENEHFSQSLGKQHQVVSALIEVPESAKPKFLSNLTQLITETQAIINQVIEIVNDQSNNHSFMRLVNFSANLQFIKLKVENTSRFIPFHISSSTYLQSVNIGDEFCETYLREVQLYLRNIICDLPSTQEKPPVSSIEDLSSAKQQSCKNFLYCFKMDDNFLIKFNTLTLEVTLKPLHLRYNYISCSILCQVSDSLLFVNGGRNSSMEFFGFTFLIDTNTMSSVRLTDGIIRVGATGLLYDFKIFIFGGLLQQNRRNIKLRTSNYFDLKLNLWRQISDLPEPQYHTSACLIENSILLSGKKNNFLQLYSIDHDTFCNLNAKVELGAIGLVLKYKEKAFLITVSKVYQASITNLAEWKIAAKVNADIYNTLNYDVAIQGKYAYFCDSYGYIFQFDCEVISLKLITRVNH